VTVRVAYSSVNYKDALAATGKGKILRRPSCIGGIDFSGTVVSSTDPRFRKGDAVATVRAQAVRALGELRDPKAVDALTALLKDADVRRRAVAALSEIRDGQSGRVRD